MSDSADNGEPLLSPSNKQHDKQQRSIPNGGVSDMSDADVLQEEVN